MDQVSCPSCQYPILGTNYFCPNCGKKLKDPPVKTGLGNQIGIYLVSILLPPMGLWPGIKYLRQNDKKAKIIGSIAIVITVLSLVVSTVATINFVNQINNSVNTQMQQLQRYGY